MKKLLLLLSLIIPIIGFSQIPDKGITVTGIASTTIMPDQVTFNFQLTNINADPVTARSGLDEKYNKLLAYLNSAGIKSDDLRSMFSTFYETTDFAAKPEDRKKQYNATLSYTLTTKDISNQNQLVNDLVKLGVTNINTQFTYSKTDELKKQLRTKAIANAHEKAVDLAKLSGLTIGKAFQIIDEESLNSSNIYIRGTNATYSTNINSLTSLNGQINITTGVRISYTLLK